MFKIMVYPLLEVPYQDKYITDENFTLIHHVYMIDFSDLYNIYKGEWVALESNEHTVIAHGHDAYELWQRAKEITSKPILKQIA
jgi:hypothetical protein